MEDAIWEHIGQKEYKPSCPCHGPAFTADMFQIRFDNTIIVAHYNGTKFYRGFFTANGNMSTLTENGFNSLLSKHGLPRPL